MAWKTQGKHAFSMDFNEPNDLNRNFPMPAQVSIL